MNITRAFSFLVLLAFTSARPAANDTILHFLQTRAPNFEWTAWGDSYASGVGARNYYNGRQCLRYDLSYPQDIQKDEQHILPGFGGKLNDVFCSGETAPDVLAYQFLEKEKFDLPDILHSPRPATGNPAMGTLTVGGDDIDFPGILNNCIVGSFPWPLSKHFEPHSCSVQLDISWKLLCQDGDKDRPNHDLVDSIDRVIIRILQWNQGHPPIGTSDFWLYVTGYPQFFNAKTDECNSATLARKPKPNSDRLTKARRNEFNHMSRTLNAAIQEAVARHRDKVRYIDIDNLLNGGARRFCEPGVQEPDQSREEGFIFHYPYNIPRNPDAQPTLSIQGLQDVYDYLNGVFDSNLEDITRKAGWGPGTPWRDLLSAFWSFVDLEDFENSLNGILGKPAAITPDEIGDFFWKNVAGWQAKLFHPKPNFHNAIYEEIIKEYKRDLDGNRPEPPCLPPNPPPAPQSSSSPSATSTQPPPAPTYEFLDRASPLSVSAQCFSDINQDGQYKQFHADSYNKARDKFCAMDYTLGAHATFSYTESADDANGVDALVTAGWAENQTGCNPEADFALTSGLTDCPHNFDLIVNACGPKGDDSSVGFGGQFVMNRTSGCILLQVMAS